MEIPFLRHATSVLAVSLQSVARLVVAPSGKVSGWDEEAVVESDVHSALDALLARWGRAPRFVVVGLPPDWVQHTAFPMPALVDEEVDEWLAVRALSGGRSTPEVREAVVRLPEAPAPVAVVGRALGRWADETLGRLHASGMVPVEMVSTLLALGYADVEDEDFAARTFTVEAAEDGASVTMQGGYPVAVRNASDGRAGDGARASWLPSASEGDLLATQPSAGSLLGREAPAPVRVAGSDTAARALAMLVRFPGLPRLGMLTDHERTEASVARERRDALRVLALTSVLVLAVGAWLAVSLRQARTEATRAQTALAAQRPDLAALEEAEARLAAQGGQARAAPLVPLLDLAARQVPRASGLYLTHVEARRDTSGRPVLVVEGFSQQAALVPAYVQALEQETAAFERVQLRYATQAPRPVRAMAFSLALLGHPALP